MIDRWTGLRPALAVLLLLGSCRRHQVPAAGNGAAVTGEVTAAAERALRGMVPSGKAASFRGMRVYSQAQAGRWAACGQVAPFPDDPVLFVLFVAVVPVGADGRAGAPDPVFAGTSVEGADQTYAALITHCYEKGGPLPEPMQGVPPLPPLPNAVPTPPMPGVAAPGPVAPAPVRSGTGGLGAGEPVGAAAPARQPASGNAVTRQNVNLHASPHGAVTRVVPQGTALRVFATAPGGWLQVGDAAPWGWIHESMLDRR